MKGMVEIPRRPTMQEIQARRKSSFTESRLSKRLGTSLPNLGDDQTISFQKSTLLTGIVISDPGETGGKAQQRHKDIAVKDLTFLCFSPLLAFASSSPKTYCLSLCSFHLLAVRTLPKPVNVFKLPDFPASLSFHSVQSYYSELIQQLGKAIFSVQNENPTLLARYNAFIIPESLLLLL